jgi:dTDP-4-amino-4,6-dideoxygalactose transaminase
MTAEPVVPFNRVLATGDELRYVREAVEGGHVSGAGPFADRCERALCDEIGSERTLLTTSCTHALEMACHLLDLGPGDQVIVPSFTFVSSAVAVAMRGATPVFADIRPDTLCLDERLLGDLVSERTKAVLLVHYGGVACELEEIAAWASGNGVAIVEDNAHGLFGTYRGRPLGSVGDLGTLSFHETKNLSCGEGGALLINRPELVSRAEVVREKGTNRSSFMRGEVEKYTWVDLGSSWIPSDLLAAFLWGQYERRREIQEQRHAVWDSYAEHLAAWAAASGFRLPEIPADREHPAHLFWLLAPSRQDRDRLLTHLASQGVHAVFHYVPLHSSIAGRRFGCAPLPLEVTDSVSASLVRLPLWAGMSGEMVNRVIEGVTSFRSPRRRRWSRAAAR